jgi:RNA polymerase sigma-70 factor (ECF subfamily)
MEGFISPEEEAVLVQQAKAGQCDAFIQLYDRCYPVIFNYIYYRVSDPGVAEDLAAEVFVRMVDRIDFFDSGNRPLLAWLYTIAQHLIIDQYRRNQSVKHVPLDDCLMDNTSAPVTEQIEALNNQKALSQACEALTEDQRRVIMLKFVQGCSNAETARILQKPETAVKSLQHRALSQLRHLLAKVGIDERTI